MISTGEATIDRGMIAFDQRHLDALVNDGFVIIEDFLDKDLLACGQAELAKIFPSWEELRDNPQEYPGIQSRTRLDLATRAPTLMAADTLNDIALHPRLLDFSERVLGTSDILLTSLALTAKYAIGQDYDQPMHVDMLSHTLVVPPDDQIDQLAAIVYYSDVSLDLGPTCVVRFADSEPYWRDMSFAQRDPFWLKGTWTPEDAPDLYAHEYAVTARAGSILLYTMRTFHRGSATTAEGARFTQHLAFQRAGMAWAGERLLPLHGLHDELGHMLSRLDPRQRSVLGFPPPHHPYWTSATCDSVQRRYPQMDLGPYRRAIAD